MFSLYLQSPHSVVVVKYVDRQIAPNQVRERVALQKAPLAVKKEVRRVASSARHTSQVASQGS